MSREATMKIVALTMLFPGNDTVLCCSLFILKLFFFFTLTHESFRSLDVRKD